MFKYVVSLAGGSGSRLGDLTAFTSKALVNVNGKPLISYSLSQIMDIENKIVTVGSFYDQMVNYISEFHVYTFINTRNRGNCWWLFNTFLKTLDEPVLVLTCDLITRIDLEFLYTQYLEVGSPANMLVPTKPFGPFDGDYLHSSQNRVTEISRTRPTGLFCTGMQIVNPSRVLKAVNACDVPEDFNLLWTELIKVGALYHSKIYPYEWHSINTKEELRLYEEVSLELRQNHFRQSAGI